MPYGPTAITLQSFTAQWRTGSGTVLVEWTTGVEINSFGFRLYRSETPERATAVQVTSDIILARGGGSSYWFEDTSAVAGKRYYYWLQETETDDNTIDYGPAVTTGPRLSKVTIFLPVIRR